jgi:hypothetical protein
MPRGHQAADATLLIVFQGNVQAVVTEARTLCMLPVNVCLFTSFCARGAARLRDRRRQRGPRHGVLHAGVGRACC